MAYQRTQRSSLHPNVMELGRGGTKPGPYWSMRWLPAGPSHVRTTVKDDRAGVFRSPARLIAYPPGDGPALRLQRSVRPALSTHRRRGFGGASLEAAV